MTGPLHLGMTVSNTSTEGGGLRKLFITENTALNALTFTIANPSGTPITLTQDQVFTVTPPAGLLNEGQFNGVGIAGPEWHIQPHSGRFTNWTIHPVKSMTVVHEQPAFFQFENLAISNKDDLGKGLFWTISWNGFGNVAGGMVERKIFVYLPVKQDLNMTAVLDTGTQILPLDGAGQPIGSYLQAYSVPYFPQYSGEILITAPDTNGIYTQHKFYLQNFGKDIKFSADSQFELNFTLCADDQTDINALCRASNFKDIDVTQIYNDPSKRWQTVQQQGQGPQMTWLLQPGEGMVFSHGEFAVFQISDIYTTLPAYITAVYVSYAGIPNTSPGLLTFDLFKKITPPAVPVLTVDGQAVPREHEGHSRLVDNPLDVGLEQRVELGWATVGVTGAQLDPKEGKNIPVALNGSYAWTPYLTAQDPGVISLSTNPQVEGGNQWIFNLKEPQIEAFLANGQNPSSQDFGPTHITWKTRYASAMTLKNQQGQVLAHYEQQNNPAAVDNGSYLLPVLQKGESFTLTAEGYQGPHEKTVKVSMNPVAIDSFLADGQSPLNMKLAGPVTFGWKTRNALSVTILDQSGTSIAHYERATDPQKMDQGNYTLPLAAYDQTYSLHADGIHSSGHQKVQVNAKRPFTLTYNPTPGPGAKGGSFDFDYDFSKVTYDYVYIFFAYFTVPDNLILYLQSKKLSGPTKKGRYTFLVSPNHWYGGWPGFLKKGTPLKIGANLVFYPNSQDPPFFNHVWFYKINFLE